MGEWTRFAEFCEKLQGRWVPQAPGKQREFSQYAKLHEAIVGMVLAGFKGSWSDIDTHLQSGGSAGRSGSRPGPRGSGFRKRSVVEAASGAQRAVGECGSGRGYGGAKAWGPVSSGPAESAEQFGERMFLRPDGRRGTVDMPMTVHDTVLRDMTLFKNGLPQLTVPGLQRDLARTEDLNRVTHRWKGGERTYLFLQALWHTAEGEVRAVLGNCGGFRQLLSWGAHRFMGDFFFDFQREFSLTREGLVAVAGEGQLQQIQETLTVCQSEKLELLGRLDELESELAQFQATARREVLAELVRRLVTPDPALNQLLMLRRRLSGLVDSGVAVSDDLLLGQIALETFFRTLKGVGITSYPADPGAEIALSEGMLSEYHYVSGRPFTEDARTIRVRCLTVGWKLGETVVIPAQVREVHIEEEADHV